MKQENFRFKVGIIMSITIEIEIIVELKADQLQIKDKDNLE
jgi:hypothetical protein